MQDNSLQKIQNLREKINFLDEKIIKALEKRFEITKKIGNYKDINQTAIKDKKREKEIFSKIDNLVFKKEIQGIYKELFKISRKQQEEKKGEKGNG